MRAKGAVLFVAVFLAAVVLSACAPKSEEMPTAVLAADQVSIAQPGIVVNMPFVAWDGGQR